MSIINNGLLLAAEAAAAGGYTIDRSLRFSSADSAFLSRTPASAGNRKTWTWAGWVKRSTSNRKTLFFAGSGDLQPAAWISFGNNVVDTLEVTLLSQEGVSTESWTQTLGVFRDYSAWYHIVCAVDTTQATASNRVKIYVNGVLQSVQVGPGGSLYPSQNFDTAVNSAVAHNIGRRNLAGGDFYFDGYLADVIFVDGQALDPTSFGEFDTNGVWQPIEYTGSYGTNGFHLDFADNSSAAALGYDAAGSNDWTVNNLSVTAGAGNDSLRDSPTNGDTANDTGLGGQVPGNYATINPLAGSTIHTVSNGNLTLTATDTNWSRKISTIGMFSGNWYAEFTLSTAGDNTNQVGVVSFIPPVNGSNQNGEETGQSMYNGYNSGTYNGTIFVDGTRVLTGQTTASSGDVIGVALDASSNNVKYYRNGTLVGSSSGYTPTNVSGTWYFVVQCNNSGVVDCNFGQRPFAYTAPSGFKALCTTNLPTPTIADGSTAMDVKLYTGNGSTQTISGLGFSPDLVWTKGRSIAELHLISDSVRGVPGNLYPNLTNAEDSNSYLSALTSDGFTVQSAGIVNSNGSTYVAWTWDGGSSTVTNTSGSISSQVRANASAGFSVVTYTGTGSAATVGHGLNAAVQFLIVKRRDLADRYWMVYHVSTGNTNRLVLNDTVSVSASSAYWNNTTPTSTVFSLGADPGNFSNSTNASNGNYVAYCFAPVAGYSAFGSYTGNGVSGDGPYIHLGFRPRFFMHKRTDSSGDWRIWDAARNTYNVIDTMLVPNSSGADYTASAVNMDFLSNGVKVRATDTTNNNASGATYVYAAFASHPFQTARAR